jgi:prepilin-type N-terminal cleavage/methylation domain-containing protein
MRKAGFTLLEILATITLATILVGPIINMMVLGSKGIYAGADRTYAILSASDLLEMVRGVDAKVLPARGPDKPYSVPEIQGLVHTSDSMRSNLVFNRQYHDRFSFAVVIDDVPGAEVPEGEEENRTLRMITVIAGWTDDRDQKRTVQLSTFVGAENDS